MKGRKTDWPRLLADVTACFLIPAYTLLFAGSMAWFRTNFSVLAVTGKDYYRGFVLWGILAATYFFTILLALARTLPQRRCSATRFLRNRDRIDEKKSPILRSISEARSLASTAPKQRERPTQEGGLF